jgi:hypothetical protein
LFIVHIFFAVIGGRTLDLAIIVEPLEALLG